MTKKILTEARVERVTVELQRMRFGDNTLGAWLTEQFGGGRRGRKRAIALCQAMAMASLDADPGHVDALKDAIRKEDPTNES